MGWGLVRVTMLHLPRRDRKFLPLQRFHWLLPAAYWFPPGKHIQADLQHAQQCPLHHMRIRATPVSAGAGNPGNPQCHLRRHPGVQWCAQDFKSMSCSPAFPLMLLRTARIPRLPVEDPVNVLVKCRARRPVDSRLQRELVSPPAPTSSTVNGISVALLHCT